MLYQFMPVRIAFTLKSTNYRGRVIDGTLHHPTFPQASNVIGSAQNHVTHTHIHSFINKRCWQLPSHRRSHRLHLQKPSLAAHDAFSTCCGTSRRETSIISLARIRFSGVLLFFFFFICGRFPRFFLGSDSKR